ncbi:MAG: AAA family ATPase [Nitrospirota bacterium]|nr:AAA family ATPase [Nitrospirota bacterium]
MNMNEPASNNPASVVIQEYWAMIVRRKWLVMSSVLAGIVVAGVLCLVLPKSYRSSTLILIENQKIPDDYVKGIGGASIEERLTMIQQQVLSRTLLSQTIEEFKLYEGQVKQDGVESTIEGMRKAIKVETVGTIGARGKSVEAVTISFSHENPMTAMNVTAKLASLFIEENLKVREQLVTGVSAFLEQELHDAKKALEAQEQAISHYKSKHMGLLPEQMEANLRALDRLQTDLSATDELIHSLTDKVSLAEKSIKEYEASGTTQGASGATATSHAGMDPLVGRLRELERALTALLAAEYTETYPDVVETKREINSVKKQLAAKYGDPAKEKDGDAAKTFDPYLRELIKQRNELYVEVSSVKDRRRRLAEHIREFEHRVEQTPSREQDVMILMRDYENRQKNYQALLDKRLNANVAENLEKRQKGEQFRVLDPANLPQTLDKPNRLLIMVLGLLGGCGLGAGLTIGLDQLNPTFKRREELEMLPKIRVLATIPKFYSGSRQLRHQTKSSLIRADVSAPLPAVRAGRRFPSRMSGAHDEEALPPQLNLVTKWQSHSIAAEQYRMAASRLVLSTEGRGSTVIQITSALKGEGKTTTVVNIGYALAGNLGKKTLLIDCDFRNPALNDYVTIPAQAGLIELLDGEASLENCLAAIDEVHCLILSVGKMGENFNELKRIQQLKAMLPNIRMTFDYVIINAPPVLPSASAGILASLADLHIMVIRAGTTPKHVVQQAFTVLGLSGEAQVVLNGVEAQTMPSAMYGYAMIGSDRSEQSIESAAR